MDDNFIAQEYSRVKSKKYQDLTNFEIGFLFEYYVMGLIDRKWINIQKWRHSRDRINRTKSDDHINPDFELILMGFNQPQFAIECKYRSGFKEQKIKWAEEHHILRYERFRYNNTVPVYIAIGVGGIPEKPKEFFIVPLSRICQNTHVTRPELLPYKRGTRKKLFFDPQTLLLF